MVEVIGIGELLIDLINQNKNRYDFFPGGAPANCMVGLSRLGTKSGMITKVGKDFFGDFLLKTLKENDVDISNIPSTENYKTGLAFVTLDKNKNPSFSFYRTPCADIMLKPEEINEEYIKNAKLLHYGTVSMADEPARSAIFHAIKLAHSNGLIVSCDPNFRKDLWRTEEPKEHLLKALKFTDMLKVSLNEAEYLTGEENESAYSRLLNLGPSTIMITTSEGCRILTKEEDIRVPGFKVDVVDTTGAGDAFVAGFIHGTINKMPLFETGRFANAAAALSITKMGAMSALPTKEEVVKLLQ